LGAVTGLLLAHGQAETAGVLGLRQGGVLRRVTEEEGFVAYGCRKIGPLPCAAARSRAADAETNSGVKRRPNGRVTRADIEAVIAHPCAMKGSARAEIVCS
jgi:hypothetical protein